VIKREKFQKIFDKTLFQCIEHIIGKKTYKELEGLEIIYENEMKELNEEDEYKDKLRQILKNYEKIFNEKKQRKKKTKK
jgi:predicted subunit of tRNA(5-methylaminomethyl-2-thiouridylate) methyltransferase